jgi:hypothetical protein
MNKKSYKNYVSYVLGLLAMGAISSAQAASLIDAATTTAIAAGWTDLKDTYLGLLGTSWAPFLGIAAIAMSPAVIKKMFKAAAH